MGRNAQVGLRDATSRFIWSKLIDEPRYDAIIMQSKHTEGCDIKYGFLFTPVLTPAP